MTGRKKKIVKIEKYKFKKGQQLHLDEIYTVQGLAGGDWWDAEEDAGDYVIVTRDVSIEIRWS